MVRRACDATRHRSKVDRKGGTSVSNTRHYTRDEFNPTLVELGP